MALSAQRPPHRVVTTPDQIDPGALGELALLERERIVRVWKSGAGFLIMTNLRCTEIWRRPKLFSSSDWEAGPNFFFYNLATPKVQFGRFLRLSEDHERNPQSVRLVVHDPHRVAQEVADARSEGQAEWLRRRAGAEARARPTPVARGPTPLVIREVVREVVKVPCSFCGTLMLESARHCPACGAPQR